MWPILKTLTRLPTSNVVGVNTQHLKPRNEIPDLCIILYRDDYLAGFWAIQIEEKNPCSCRFKDWNSSQENGYLNLVPDIRLWSKFGYSSAIYTRDIYEPVLIQNFLASAGRSAWLLFKNAPPQDSSSLKVTPPMIKPDEIPAAQTWMAASFCPFFGSLEKFEIGEDLHPINAATRQDPIGFFSSKCHLAVHICVPTTLRSPSPISHSP